MDNLHLEIEQLKLKIESLEEEKQNLTTLNEDLSLELKYTLFDAHLLKKEKDALRRLLDDKTSQ